MTSRDTPWETDLKRLHRVCDKTPRLTQTFSGDVYNSNVFLFKQELMLQLVIHNIKDLHKFPDHPAGPDDFPAAVPGEPDDHFKTRRSAWIAAQYALLLSLLTDQARSFVMDLSDLPTYSSTLGEDTILNRLYTKFLPANYHATIRLSIMTFIAPPTARPSTILASLVKLNTELDAHDRFSDTHLKDFMIKSLPQPIMDRMDYVADTASADTYAVAADRIFHRLHGSQTFPSAHNSAQLPVCALKPGNATTQHPLTHIDGSNSTLD